MRSFLQKIPIPQQQLSSEFSFNPVQVADNLTQSAPTETTSMSSTGNGQTPQDFANEYHRLVVSGNPHAYGVTTARLRTFVNMGESYAVCTWEEAIPLGAVLVSFTVKDLPAGKDKMSATLALEGNDPLLQMMMKRIKEESLKHRDGMEVKQYRQPGSSETTSKPWYGKRGRHQETKSTWQ